MAKIYVSGLINTETTVKVQEFPIPYYPIDYPFFGVQTTVSGVGYNLAKAFTALGDRVALASYLGNDTTAEVILTQLQRDGIDLSLIRRELGQTPASVVLYDNDGRRQIYCDLKDIQERSYPVREDGHRDQDVVVACNINFNRELLHMARKLGKLVATDVHVLSDVEDGYNREFMENANILFLSDEGLPCGPQEFVAALAGRYGSDIIVLGRGDKGASLYVKAENAYHELPCVQTECVVNTVGAGDARFSGFLHFYTEGFDPVMALWYAQIFASAKISAQGGAQGFLSEAEVMGRYMQ